MSEATGEYGSSVAGEPSTPNEIPPPWTGRGPPGGFVVAPPVHAPSTSISAAAGRTRARLTALVVFDGDRARVETAEGVELDPLHPRLRGPMRHERSERDDGDGLEDVVLGLAVQGEPFQVVPRTSRPGQQGVDLVR